MTRDANTVLLVCGMVLFSYSLCPAAVFDVAQYGAKADGVTLDTAAVQAAINACTPGGTVLVGPGRYVVGTLWLKSDMEFRVAQGAELFGSISIGDYSRDNEGAIEAPAFDECLLYAKDAKNLTLSGKGIVNGRGTKEHFPVKVGKSLGDRPMLIRLVDCQNVTFTDITLKNAASWCTHMVDCDDIVIRNVTLDNHVNTNNDGFDLDGCKNILIEDCNIRSGDDSICPKSTTERLCENLVVKNCRVQSNTAAFKCGTSSRGGFRNMSVTDCDFSGCRMGVIKLLTVDGGILEDITISNIVMNDVEGPIFIPLANRGRTYEKPTEQIYGQDVKAEGLPPGTVKNIRISNIRATVTGEKYDRQGIMISGIPGHYIEDVALENIDITYPGSGPVVEKEVAEDIARYPEQFFFGTLPSWGAYIRHARNVEFKNVTMSTLIPDPREKIVQVDVEGFVEH
ncbi:glycoside hydrolase family 28 protein [Planctomycetota bacterium]